MDWKKKTLLISVSVGAALGFITAKMMIKNAENSGEIISFDVQNGARIAMTLLETVKKLS